MGAPLLCQSSRGQHHRQAGAGVVRRRRGAAVALRRLAAAVARLPLPVEPPALLVAVEEPRRLDPLPWLTLRADLLVTTAALPLRCSTGPQTKITENAQVISRAGSFPLLWGLPWACEGASKAAGAMQRFAETNSWLSSAVITRQACWVLGRAPGAAGRHGEGRDASTNGEGDHRLQVGPTGQVSSSNVAAVS